MKDLKLELFNFKRNMTINDSNDSEMYNIVENHLAGATYYSELEVINSLSEKLKPYTYRGEIRSLIESLNTDILGNKLSYDLKNLYTILNRQEGHRALYLETPIKKIMEIISIEDESTRISKILNELSTFSFVPEIKQFVLGLTQTPQERNNLISNGKAEKVYTVVECVGADQYVTFIKNKWFHLTNTNIEPTLLENHIKDEAKLLTLRNLEKVMIHGEVIENRVNVYLSEDLMVGIDETGSIYLNETKMNEEATLEVLYQNSIIPSQFAAFYPILRECIDNFDKFAELDIATKVTNVMNPKLECVVFNLLEGSNYIYNIDRAYGDVLYEYKNAVEVIHEIQQELNYDISYFFPTKLKESEFELKKLENKEKEIISQMEILESMLSKLDVSIMDLGEDEVFTEARKKIVNRQALLEKKRLDLQEQKELTKVRK